MNGYAHVVLLLDSAGLRGLLLDQVLSLRVRNLIIRNHLLMLLLELWSIEMLRWPV